MIFRPLLSVATVLAFALATFSSAIAQQYTSNESISTLKDAIHSAIENHPEVEEKWHNFLSSSYGYKASRSGYRPKVDFAIGYDARRQDYGPNRSYNGAYGEITLTQMLYDGAFTRSEVSRFDNLQLVSYFNLLETSEKVALETFAAYLDVLKQRELVELARKNFSTHHRVFKQIEKSAKAGVARSADLEQINGRLALAQSNLVTEMSNLHDISARYMRLVGTLPAAKLDNFNFVESPLPDNVEDTLLLAYQGSPIYHAALRNILAAESANQAAKSDYRPKINLNARYGSQTYDGLGYDDGQSEASIGIELRYNLYNGGHDKANIRRSLQQINAAKDQRDLACINVRQSVQVAFNATRTLSEQLPILNRHRLASARVATSYKQQFDIGQRTLLDVLDIENEHFQAGRAWVNARYDIEIAQARTLSSMGKLVESLGLYKSDLPSLSDLGTEAIQVDENSACFVADINTQEGKLQDADMDGVPDVYDQCPNTPTSDKVDEFGCSIFEQGEAISILNVQFATESVLVEAKYYDAIEEFAVFLKRYPNTKVEISGHSSVGGPESYNQRLSHERAKAVAAILSNNFGINQERITTAGYGTQKLKRKDKSKAADAVNRRIEAKVTNK